MSEPIATAEPAGGATAHDLPPLPDTRLIMVQSSRLEERINQLIDNSKSHGTDFRWTWGGLVLGFLTLAGFVIGVYTRMDDKFARIDERFAKVDEKFVAIDDRFNKVDDRLNRMDARLDKVETRMDKV